VLPGSGEIANACWITGGKTFRSAVLPDSKAAFRKKSLLFSI
jgi:hypothetical protein